MKTLTIADDSGLTHFIPESQIQLISLDTSLPNRPALQIFFLGGRITLPHPYGLLALKKLTGTQTFHVTQAYYDALDSVEPEEFRDPGAGEVGA